MAPRAGVNAEPDASLNPGTHAAASAGPVLPRPWGASSDDSQIGLRARAARTTRQAWAGKTESYPQSRPGSTTRTPPSSSGRCLVSTAKRDPIRAAAQFLAHLGKPGIGQQLLTEHAADTSGHCRACRSSSGASPVSPCNLWLIGTHVQQLTPQGPTAMTRPPAGDGTPGRPHRAAPSLAPEPAAASSGPRLGRGRRRPTRL